MIVITTHNGQKFIIDLLSDINKFNIPNEEICIVDNGSTSESHLKYLNELNQQGYKILYNPYGGYNLGGYKYALDNLKSDSWFCIQDSIRIKTDIFSQVKPLLTFKNAYTFLTFTSGLYDSQDDRLFLQMNYGTIFYSKGMFPSAYFALDEVMQKVKNDWILPKNKIEAMAMERGACVVFDRHKIEIKGLDIYDPPKTGDPNGYTHFYKIYGGRA